MCDILSKNHEEARELLVRAVVNNNALLMLNHSLFEEKISFCNYILFFILLILSEYRIFVSLTIKNISSLQRFAASLQSKTFFWSMLLQFLLHIGPSIFTSSQVERFETQTCLNCICIMLFRCVLLFFPCRGSKVWSVCMYMGTWTILSGHYIVKFCTPSNQFLTY